MTISVIGNPLHHALGEMDNFEGDIAWWQARIDAWKGGRRPEHATNGWSKADDIAGLEFRQEHFIDAQAKAIAFASAGTH